RRDAQREVAHDVAAEARRARLPPFAGITEGRARARLGALVGDAHAVAAVLVEAAAGPQRQGWLARPAARRLPRLAHEAVGAVVDAIGVAGGGADRAIAHGARTVGVFFAGGTQRSVAG